MKNSREKTVVKTSVISICANLILVGFKTAIGLLSNSIAIITDAINNLSDALSSIITIIGTKLANRAPDKKHPFGHGRIEYITSLVVSAIVLYAGVTAFIESIKKIITPEDVNYDATTIIILVAGIIIKFTLGLYVKKKGRDIKSDSLVASGADAFNDAILSISVLASAIIFMLFYIDLEAYVSILVSLYIIKTGIELIKGSLSSVLDTRIESSLAKSIKKEVLKEPAVKGAFDLVLNDYGPDKYLGSIHIEVPDTLTATDIDKISRNITKRIQQKFGIILHTIGIYSINTKNKSIIEAKKQVEKIIFDHPEILQMHGFYLDIEEKTISFDIIIDFNVKNYDKVYRNILTGIKQAFPDYNIAITLDIDASD